MAKGEITHIEFPADDPQRARRFYAAVAGWDIGEPMEGMPDYYMFRNGDASGGAIGKRGVSTGKTLRIYITVDSLEDAVAAAEANGGATVEPPTDIGGGMGRYAVVRDTEGSEVGLWESTGDAPA
jgi:predicted enzyme related to lactoylglutathione lyase